MSVRVERWHNCTMPQNLSVSRFRNLGSTNLVKGNPHLFGRSPALELFVFGIRLRWLWRVRWCRGRRGGRCDGVGRGRRSGCRGGGRVGGRGGVGRRGIEQGDTVDVAARRHDGSRDPALAALPGRERDVKPRRVGVAAQNRRGLTLEQGADHFETDARAFAHIGVIKGGHRRRARHWVAARWCWSAN